MSVSLLPLLLFLFPPKKNICSPPIDSPKQSRRGRQSRRKSKEKSKCRNKYKKVGICSRTELLLQTRLKVLRGRRINRNIRMSPKGHLSSSASLSIFFLSSFTIFCLIVCFNPSSASRLASNQRISASDAHSSTEKNFSRSEFDFCLASPDAIF